jgi:hypothetical protein
VCSVFCFTVLHCVSTELHCVFFPLSYLSAGSRHRTVEYLVTELHCVFTVLHGGLSFLSFTVLYGVLH